jgi:thiol-disulfide isomerase/thioredoxin
MKRILFTLTVLAAVALLDYAISRPALAADKPSDRVVVMYFHRTHPCPTCRKMSAFTEEAVKNGFAEQMKSGKVEYHYIDFQDENNAELVKGYSIERPTLIVAQVVDNKVKEHKNLGDIWDKVDDKDDFVKYVRENVKKYTE